MGTFSPSTLAYGMKDPSAHVRGYFIWLGNVVLVA